MNKMKLLKAYNQYLQNNFDQNKYTFKEFCKIGNIIPLSHTTSEQQNELQVYYNLNTQHFEDWYNDTLIYTDYYNIYCFIEDLPNFDSDSLLEDIWNYSLSVEQ